MSAEIVPGGGLAHGEHVSCLNLPAVLNAAGWARRLVAVVLSAWQLPPECVQSAQLVASELVANAALISGCKSLGNDAASARNIAVVLRLLPGRVVIEVTDDDPRPPVLGDPAMDDENGRGLFMVQAMSKEWGYYAPPSGGKVVFAIVLSERAAGEGN